MQPASLRSPARSTPSMSGLVGALAVLLALALAPAPSGAADWQVVGGGPAPPEQARSTVALVRANDTDAALGQFCAGTAIGPDLVLTAAHCFHTVDGERSRDASDVHVVAGRADLSADGGRRVLVSEVHIHPDYRFANHHQDIAVLRTAATLDVEVQQLAAADSEPPAPGVVAIVLGWGRTGPSADAEDSAELLAGHVEVHDGARCAESFDPPPDPAAHVCAGGMGTAEDPQPDACSGDSGGPLLLPTDDEAIQIGITAFGPADCGVDAPGVYASVAAGREFIDRVIEGAPVAPPPETALVPAGLRIGSAEVPTTAIAQAVAASQAVFADADAQAAVITRPDVFADALSGSALLFARGPLLYTAPGGPLAPETEAELRRAVAPGSPVFLLGGSAAIDEDVERQVAEAGYEPIRLAGMSREGTSAAVAREVIQRFGYDRRPPFGTVVLATSGAWPDAVLAGQLSVWWGYPVLLTQSESLPNSIAVLLEEHQVERILVVGGTAAVSDDVVADAMRVSGAAQVIRLAGGSRVQTGLAIANFQRAELRRRGQPPPDSAVVVNVRRDDGYAHVLSAAPILGATAGIYVPIEGDRGDILPVTAEAAICGLQARGIGVGGEDLLDGHVLRRVSLSLGQSAC